MSQEKRIHLSSVKGAALDFVTGGSPAGEGVANGIPLGGIAVAIHDQRRRPGGSNLKRISVGMAGGGILGYVAGKAVEIFRGRPSEEPR